MNVEQSHQTRGMRRLAGAGLSAWCGTGAGFAPVFRLTVWTVHSLSMLIKVDSEGPGARDRGWRADRGGRGETRGQNMRKYQLEGQTITIADRDEVRMMLSGNERWQKTLQAIMDTLCIDELSFEFFDAIGE